MLISSGDCLWRKDDITEHPNSLAAWHMVYRPKGKGGLGVISLEVQNEALLLKHLFKIFNRADIYPMGGHGLESLLRFRGSTVMRACWFFLVEGCLFLNG